MGDILSGEVEITIDGNTEVLGSGDAYYVPSNVQHEFRVSQSEGVEYLGNLQSTQRRKSDRRIKLEISSYDMV